MHISRRVRRAATVAAMTTALSCAAAGMASADVVPPVSTPPIPPVSEYGRILGDSLNCQINYRIWVENDANAPRRARVNVQAVGIDTLPIGPVDSCGQWLTLRWNVAAPERLGAQKWGEQQIYLQGTHTATSPITVDADLTDIPSAGPLTLIVIAMSRPAGYIPFANWGPEASISAVYAIP